MKDNKNLLKDEKLDGVSGGTKSPPMLDDVASAYGRPKIEGAFTNALNTMTCIYCGGVMRSNIKGKMTGGIYTCTECGATYNPTIPDPWKKGND